MYVIEVYSKDGKRWLAVVSMLFSSQEAATYWIDNKGDKAFVYRPVVYEIYSLEDMKGE